MTSNIRVGIFGGSGYGGSELLRILLQHPNVDISFVTANEQAGKPVSEVHRNLFGLTDLVLTGSPDNLETLENIECAFLGLPHGQAMDIAPRLPANVKVIDLVIGPGDLFFLPVGWWHYVRGLEVSITMTFTNFAFDNDFYSMYTTYEDI